ncbi:hypothetical protein FY150_21070 [Agrobacterium tumefaciens]|nr:hypothetical protein FY150_21070 [Agrobacterium tumefaciens]
MPFELDDVDSFRKDQKLDRLAERFNVAQFVSFAPSPTGPKQEFSRLANFEPNLRFETPAIAVAQLLNRSADGAINIRSFSRFQSQSREFIYGLRSVDDALSALVRISAEGAFTIVNETVDVSDGGVSGVAMGGLVEFRPDATPRGVEKQGFASLPLDLASRVLNAVYGFEVDLKDSCNARIEFSLHPVRRGWKQSHILFWEYGELSALPRPVSVSWPNDFSRLLGDKVYGLLIAHCLGFRVPKTVVINRRVAPFTFGTDTGQYDHWIRTSPNVQVPGKFTTVHGWRDPFKLVQAEDSGGEFLSSILSQQAVFALFSGAAIESADGAVIIEGTRGVGDRFMVGEKPPEILPPDVTAAVERYFHAIRAKLGSIRFEWVYDGDSVWIVQLHVGASHSLGDVIVPGESTNWVDFDVTSGLEALRSLIESLAPDCGIYLSGAVGLTSHIADVVRKANVPTRIKKDRN